jgi:hypothetical protein
MKLDKDTLIKHRFWVLLGLEVPLVLAAVAVLLVGVRSAIAKLQTEVETKRDAPTKLTAETVRNQDWVDKLGKKEAEVDKILTKIWADAWTGQADLQTWPTDPTNLQTKFTGGLFATKIKVTRAAAGEKPQSGEEAAPKDEEATYVVRGTVVALPTSEDPTVVVRTTGDKGQPSEATFFLTPNMTMSVNGEAEKTLESFGDLKPGDKVEVTYLRGKYFGDDFTLAEKREFWKGYKKQFPSLKDFLKNSKGQMVVQLKEKWGEKEQYPPLSMIPYVTSWDINDPGPSDKIWNAQEDYWIRRELLRIVQNANQFVARFKGAGGTEEKKTYVFTSPLWRLQLSRVKDAVTGKLTNITRHRQRLDVSFLVQLSAKNRRGRARLGEIKVPGETLGAGASVPVEAEFGGETPEGLFGVEQVLTFATAPIKRVDQIMLGKHSHRTAIKPFKPRFGVEIKTEEKQAEGAGAEGDARGAGDTRGAGAAVRGKGPGMGMDRGVGAPARGEGDRRGGGGAGEEAADELNPLRYTEATEQFRKMPVAVVLVMDQDSAHYALTAFEESPLRFQITQVTLTRFPQALQEETSEGAAEGDRREGDRREGDRREGQPRGEDDDRRPGNRNTERAAQPSGGRGKMGVTNPGVPAFRMPQGRRGGMSMVGPMGGTGRFVPPSGEEGDTGGGVEDDQEPLIELVVYGFATLYERYPPKPAAAKIAAPAAPAAAPEAAAEPKK